MTRYFVSVGERTVEVDVGPDGVRVEGRPVNAELVRLPGSGVRSLLVDGRSHRLVARRTGTGSWNLHLNGGELDLSVLDERGRRIRELSAVSGGPAGPKPVVAPMPGMVMAVEVEVGDEVVAGQGVVIIEAMKMENELKAEGEGRVKAVHAEPGQAVEKGAILVEWE
jgi:acetyl/propionyl-CoA carboxylase alpha subunit